MTLPMLSQAVNAPPAVLKLLARLHEQSLRQEEGLYGPTGRYSAIQKLQLEDAEQAKARTDDLMKDKFIALEADKACAVYSLIRATGALNVVEAGTSFGVSTIYLALAVSQNAEAVGRLPGAAKVIATEFETTKAARAREHWAEAGEKVAPWIELREGDLRETLKVDLPATIDFVLLDIWTPMALPVLQMLEPNFRPGTIIITDNTISSAKGYETLLEYIHRHDEKYKTLTLPFSGGLEMTTYWP